MFKTTKLTMAAMCCLLLSPLSSNCQTPTGLGSLSPDKNFQSAMSAIEQAVVQHWPSALHQRSATDEFETYLRVVANNVNSNQDTSIRAKMHYTASIPEKLEVFAPASAMGISSANNIRIVATGFVHVTSNNALVPEIELNYGNIKVYYTGTSEPNKVIMEVARTFDTDGRLTMEVRRYDASMERQDKKYTYMYDAAGRMVETMEYNLNGTTETPFNGSKHEIKHDGSGRISEVFGYYFDAGTNNWEETLFSPWRQTFYYEGTSAAPSYIISDFRGMFGGDDFNDSFAIVDWYYDTATVNSGIVYIGRRSSHLRYQNNNATKQYSLMHDNKLLLDRNGRDSLYTSKFYQLGALRSTTTRWTVVRDDNRNERYMMYEVSTVSTDTLVNTRTEYAFNDKGYLAEALTHSPAYGQRQLVYEHYTYRGTTDAPEIGFSSPVTMFPNPVAGGMVTVAGLEQGAHRLRVLDISGRTVKTETLQGTTIAVTTEGLPAGLYFLQVKSDKSSHSFKLVKQ